MYLANHVQMSNNDEKANDEQVIAFMEHSSSFK